MEQKTKQFRKRNAILSCLRSTCAHPSAETVHQMLSAEHPDISLATVYRNLAMFKRQGIIRSLGAVGGVERFDGNPEPHVHFICDRCHAILDLPRIAVPDWLRGAAQSASGGRVEGCQLSFTGLCPACCHRASGRKTM